MKNDELMLILENLPNSKHVSVAYHVENELILDLATMGLPMVAINC